MSKYHSKKTVVDGKTFDSRKEAQRYQELRLAEIGGLIEDLRTQVPFELIPEYREPDYIGPKGGIKEGKLIESACKYIADFVYTENGQRIVEDCKGFRTDVYRIKRKLMYDRYRIRIRET